MRATVRCAVCGTFVELVDDPPSSTTSIRKHAVLADGRWVQFPGARFTLYFCKEHPWEAQLGAQTKVEAGILEAMGWCRTTHGNLEPVIA